MMKIRQKFLDRRQKSEGRRKGIDYKQLKIKTYG
jgi:hypothetical protein